jgi:hydroxymethylglutaryl-CoA synthase
MMAERLAAVALLDLRVAFPRHRLERTTIAEAWGRRCTPGSLPLAGFDEDSLTLAGDALRGILNHGQAGALVMASTSHPHGERSTVAVLAEAFGLAPDSTVIDAGASLAASTSIVALLADRVRARGQMVIGLAADCRRARPGTDLETRLGDAGAAFSLGPVAEAGIIATLIGEAAIASDVPETWRAALAPELTVADPSFAPQQTLVPLIERIVRAACADAGVAPDDVTAVAAGAPDTKFVVAALSAAGCSAGAGAPVTESADLAGFSGSATPWLALACALRRAAPGSIVVQFSAGGGCATAAVWRVEAGNAAWTAAGAGGLDSPIADAIPTYARALRLRGLIGNETVEPYASMPLLAREADQDIRLLASRCEHCGRVDFPQRRVCVGCGSTRFDTTPLSRRGRLVTFTEDYVYPAPEPPTVMAVADMDGGGRFFGQLTGAGAGVARTGLRVELVLRKLHTGGDWTHYFWKLRPVEEPVR